MASTSTFRAGPPSPFHSTSPSGYSNVDAYGRRLPPNLHPSVSQGTLGPVFSDEEDGDDSDFIAAKMAQLGFAPDGRAYQGAMASPPSSAFSPFTSTPTQSEAMQAELLRALQQQQSDRLRYQQQALLQQLNFPLPVPSSDFTAPSQATTSAQQAALNQQLRAQMVAQEQAQRFALAGATQAAAAAPLQQQYINQLQQLQFRQMQLAALQSQSLASAFAQPNAYPQSISPPLGRAPPAAQPPNEQRLKSLAQTSRSTSRIPTNVSVSDASSSPPSPVEHIREGSNSSTASTGKAQGRFAQAKQAMEASGGASPLGSLQALLARRQPVQGPSPVSPGESVGTSPTSSTAEELPNKREMLSGIGLGRPSPISQASDRSTTLPVPLVQKQSIPPTRAASYAAPAAVVRRAVPVRQPNGPPGNADKLKEDNFKAMIRRKAGLGLGMLNRRSEPTTPNPNAS